MRNLLKNAKNIGIVLILAVIIFSCHDNSPSPANSANAYVDGWIKDNMDYYYLWDDKIPASADETKDPETFFKSLLYTQEDRFSWIQDNYVDLLNELQGVNKEAGYEFVLYKVSTTSDNVVAQIVYIKPNSPAGSAGLKRGDVISKINGQQITTTNYSTLLDATKNNYTINYTPLDVETQQFGDEKTLSLNVVEYAEDPVYLSKIFTVNDHTIGYFVYNFFATGTDADSTKYDQEMDAVFANFKSQGITDLILDLRYNSGGSEISANTLASLVGTGVNSSKIFFRREYNPKVEEQILTGSGNNEDVFKRKFYDKANNVGSQLNGSTVYVLTGSHTASASELVINALKPYMGVFLIGNTTYGKNVGSMSIYEENDPKNKWGMQPIIVKAYNSLDQSDYSHGFTPDILNEDNSLLIYPLGDERENLLKAAIAKITGVSQPGREARAEDKHEVVGHSLDLRKRSYQLIIDKKITSLLHR